MISYSKWNDIWCKFNMKTILLFISFFAIVNYSSAQEIDDTSLIQIVKYPDIDAEFPGGMALMIKYIIENLVVPDGYEATDFTGKIYISFTVNVDGKISNAKVERGIDEKLNQNVIELIQGMPNWKPAKLNGEPVPSKVWLPVQINVQM